MATVLLELSRLEFDTIGSLEEVQTGHFTVSRRPLTFNMNELMASANLPESVFPSESETFRSAREYFSSLATQHLLHLQHQRLDAITSEEDCRRKFLARYLFLNIIKTLIPEDDQQSPQNPPFRLYCDDFRPSNVLIDPNTSHISGLIDWEFAYIAPMHFSSVAPWWLLLQSPEDWEGDLNLFLARYKAALRIFVSVLRDHEDKLIQQGMLHQAQRLSDKMETSLENGLFWICLASRYSDMFDEVYWGFTSLEERVGRLREGQRREMEGLVKGGMGLFVEHEDKGTDADMEWFEDHYPIDRLLEL